MIGMLSVYNALELGSIYGIAAIGVYLTFRIIDFPDLTVNSSFTSGAAVMAVMLSNSCNFYLSIITAGAVGAASGAVTAMLNTMLNIQSLLAGIISMIGLYSINMRIMGKPNVVMSSQEVSHYLYNFTPYIIAFLVCYLLYRFFHIRNRAWYEGFW
ncbi:ABC transporter permease N-terminal domain protein [Candidatus Cyrtobacter comes]|uniref:ABC transporter permease N-terminal domain protein n=2 Tax=Candidatus Cyrtobacter comes TaxID=675776 RepID=A0ABU5L9E2_9RICK|nr:ABC transporter permease N-terminal domain protein [Candidatus Cyrtobacter comes]